MKGFSKKIDYIFWFLVMLLPIIVYFVMYFRNSSVVPFFEFLSGFSPFVFIQNIFDDMTELVFNTTFKLNAYLSYCVGVEVFHCLFDFVVFIPRLAHKWISVFCQDK